MKFFNVKQLLVVAITMGSISQSFAVDLSKLNDVLQDTIKAGTAAVKVGKGDISECDNVLKFIDDDINDFKAFAKANGLTVVAQYIPSIDAVKRELANLLGKSTDDIKAPEMADFLYIALKAASAKLPAAVAPGTPGGKAFAMIQAIQKKISNCSRLAMSEKQMDALLAELEA